MTTKIKIGLAEDHGALRQGYVTLLKAHEKFEVLFDVNDGRELMEKLKTVRPQILLLDLEMPIMNGARVLEVMKTKYPSIKVIVVSAHFTKNYIIESFKLGAKAFLRKEHTIERIIDAINITAEQGGFVDNEVGLILANELSSTTKIKKQELTEHQIEVLALIAKGCTNKEAADKLDVSIGAIKFHRSNIMLKTGCKTTTELMAYAIQNKYI